MKIIGIDNWAEAIELINHVFNATRKLSKLDIVDEEQCWLLFEHARVEMAEIGGKAVARQADHRDGVLPVYSHAVVVDKLVILGH